MAQEEDKQLSKTQSQELYVDKLKDRLKEQAIFSIVKDPETLASYQVEITADKAIDTMSMALIREVNIDACETALDLLIGNLLVRFEKLNNKFEEYEIPFIIESILKNYWYLTLDEIAYIFNKGITGAYKMNYNKLDVSTVMDWIHQYDSRERLAIAERRDQQKADEQRKLDEAIFKGVSKEFVSTMIKKIAEENNVVVESKSQVSDKEKAYQMAKMKALAGRKKFLDEDGNEIQA